jgi:hypothetical protein
MSTSVFVRRGRDVTRFWRRPLFITFVFLLITLLAWFFIARNLAHRHEPFECSDNFVEYVESPTESIGVHESQIYIGMVTGRGVMKARAKPAHDAWMRHFRPQNNFIFTTEASQDTSQEDHEWFPDAKIVEVPDSGDDYWSAQYRFVYGMKYLLEIAQKRQDDKVRWFYITDDDTFVVPRNLYRLIARLNAQKKYEEPAFVGNCNYPHTDRFLGGSGVLITKPALELYFENEHTCAHKFEKRKVEQYYDYDLPICYQEILKAKGLPFKPCTSAPEMFTRMLVDKCSSAYVPPLDYQLGSFHKHIMNSAAFHFYYKPEDMKNIIEFYPREYFDIRQCTPHYFELDELMQHKNEIETPVAKKVTDSDIRVVRVSKTDDQTLAKSIAEQKTKKKKLWVLFVGQETCVETNDLLPKVLSYYKPSEALLIGGIATRKDMQSRKIPFGAGFAVSQEWINRATMNCEDNLEKCAKIVLKQVPRLITDETVRIREGSFLVHHPLHYCTKEGIQHFDVVEGPLRPEEMAVFGPSSDKDDKCFPQLYTSGTYHFEMWQKLEQEKKEKQKNKRNKIL